MSSTAQEALRRLVAAFEEHLAAVTARRGEQDLAVSFPDGVRCRVKLFRQQGAVSAAIRLLSDHIPTLVRHREIEAKEAAQH